MADLNKMRLGQPKLKVKLSVDEEWAVEGLYKKYGIKFDAQSKDHKVNTFQWTAIQCKKKYDSYMKRYGKCPK